MSETLIDWFRTAFDITYLVVTWGLVLTMFWQRDRVTEEKRPLARLFLWIFFLLILGDSFHLGIHLLIQSFNQSEVIVVGGASYHIWSIGVLLTSITVTFFYALLLVIWHKQFQKPYGWFGYLLFATAVLRLLIFIPPINEWNSGYLPQPWSIYRNSLLMLQGLGVAYLILRDARAENNRVFKRIGTLILVSFACFIPVILFAPKIPALGMLMIPKTIAYVVIGFVAYFYFYTEQAAIVSPVSTD